MSFNGRNFLISRCNINFMNHEPTNQYIVLQYKYGEKDTNKGASDYQEGPVLPFPHYLPHGFDASSLLVSC